MWSRGCSHKSLDCARFGARSPKLNDSEMSGVPVQGRLADSGSVLDRFSFVQLKLILRYVSCASVKSFDKKLTKTWASSVPVSSSHPSPDSCTG